MITGKKNIALFFTVTLAVVFWGQIGFAQKSVRTDGLYYAKKGKFYYYLRFYERGEQDNIPVIGEITTEKPEQVTQWLIREKASFKGSYWYRTNYIDVRLGTMSGPLNSLDYKCKLVEDKLKTKWNHWYEKAGKRKHKKGKLTFAFIPSLLAKKENEELLTKKKEMTNIRLSQSARKASIVGIMKYLYDGADVNAKDSTGGTPLLNLLSAKCVAFPIGQGPEVIEAFNLLLDNGADVNVQNDMGDTPLHFAAACHNTIFIETLLKHNVDVNKKNELGWTPLRQALIRNNKKAVKLLLDNGAEASVDERARIKELLTPETAGPVKTKEKKRIVQKTTKPTKAQTTKITEAQKAQIAKKDDEQFLGPNNVGEVITFDQYGLYNEILLKNKKGELVAKKLIMRSPYNPMQITAEIVRDVAADKDIHFTEIEGEAKNPILICLDKDGNILKKAQKPVLVKPFQEIQKTEFKIKYHGAFIDKKYKIFYPCSNCASKTGHKDCAYVW